MHRYGQNPPARLAVALGLAALLAPILAGCGQGEPASQASAGGPVSASSAAPAVQRVDLATANLICEWHIQGMFETYYWTTDGTKTLEKRTYAPVEKPIRLIAVTEGATQHEVSVDDVRKIWSVYDTDTANPPATGPYLQSTLVHMGIASMQRMIDLAANPSLEPNVTVVHEQLDGKPVIHVTAPLPPPTTGHPVYADYLSFFTPTDVWLDADTSLPIEAAGMDGRYTADDPQNEVQYRYYEWLPRTAESEAMFATQMPADYRQVTPEKFSDVTSSGGGR